MDELVLYSYYRSSCAYRVRIALHLKNLDFEYRPIHLVRDGGEQRRSEYLKLNPMAQVPFLIHNGKGIAQSMAILEYLDFCFPGQKLFPADPFEAAQVRQLCETINSGIQPLQNLSVLMALDDHFKVGDQGKKDWSHHWIERGFKAFEKMLVTTAGDFCFGDDITAADALLAPQIYNANRYAVDLDQFPNIKRVWERCQTHEAFLAAEPARQIDAPVS